MIGNFNSGHMVNLRFAKEQLMIDYVQALKVAIQEKPKVSILVRLENWVIH